MTSPSVANDHYQEQQSQDMTHIKHIGPYCVSQDPPFYLTSVHLSDVPEMVRVLNINKDIYNGTASFQFPYLEEHAIARIKRALGYHTSHGRNTHWAMRTSPDGPLMGWLHVFFEEPEEHEVHPISGRPLVVAEYGYWVSPEHTGKGHAVRAAQFFIEHIIAKETDVDILRAESYMENTASRKVMQRSGMTLEKECSDVYISKLKQIRQIATYAWHRDPCTQHIKKQNYMAPKAIAQVASVPTLS
ncbi:hypothetical protein BGW42_005421 [Actinomortierella wolfii]|nr:hypothetical protein BGW42_005421 [Actinomortierella wolfii]